MQVSSKKIIRGVLSAGVVFCWLVFFVMEIPTSYRLKHYGIKTQGVITAKEPHNHKMVVYSYQIASATYTGRDVLPEKMSFDEVQIGEIVTVIYDPRLHGTSSLEVRENLWFGLVLAIGGSILAGLATAFSAQRATLSDLFPQPEGKKK